MGGLARLATSLAAIRKDSDGVLFVASGDELTGPQVLEAQRGRRARLIVDTYAALGIDAMGTGEKDHDPSVDDALLQRVRGGALVNRAGLRVGIFSADVESTTEAERPARAAELTK